MTLALERGRALIEHLIGQPEGATLSSLKDDLQLPAGARYTNHLGTVHAGALMALAEACSGEALLGALSDIQDGILPLVRRFECKFRKPAIGMVSGSVHLTAGSVQILRSAILTKGKALIEVPVDLHDESMTPVMSATVEWFVAKKKEA